MLLFVKFGGSVLTDKHGQEALNEQLLRSVVATLAEARRARPELQLLLGHGGGSFGHYWAQRYRTAEGIIDAESWMGVARVADAMARLSRQVVALLLEAGVPAVSIQSSASAVSSSRALRELATQPIRRLLASGVVPVVYGDVAVDEQQGCAILSTERIFTYLARILQPQMIVLVGEGAVYTADPRRDPAATPIAEISGANYAQVVELLGGSHGVDVTGGMRSKVEQMWELVQAQPGLAVQIVGPEEAQLAAVLRGERPTLGTLIRP